MKTKSEFREFARSLISDNEQAEYQKCRKRRNILLYTIIPIEVVFAIVVGILAGGFEALLIEPFLILFIILPSIAVIYSANSFKWGNFKQERMTKLFEFLLDDYVYSYFPGMYVPEARFKDSHFSGSYDKYTGEDLFSINIKNDDGTSSDVKFTMSDLKVTSEKEYTKTHYRSDGSSYTTTETRTITEYSGAFGYIDFPFSFKCSLGINAFAYGGDRIKLEDIQFNKKFAVYTDNQVEALCILTPTMITKLKALNKTMGTIKLALTGSKMYLGMDRNLFEFDKYGKELSEKAFDRIYDDVYCIVAIIDEIAKNNKVFKM